MATAFPLNPAYRRVSVEEFLEMDFQGAKAELDEGLIYMMAGGDEPHAAVAVDLIVALATRLRGSGCRAYGSDFATRTKEQSIRHPDVSVYCRPATEVTHKGRLLGDPQVVVEVLSPSTAAFDQKIKLEEYQALPGVREIALADHRPERIRLAERAEAEGWRDDWLPHGAPVELPSLGVTIPHAEIFARD